MLALAQKYPSMNQNIDKSTLLISEEHRQNTI